MILCGMLDLCRLILALMIDLFWPRAAVEAGKCPEFFAHLDWAERRPALAQAVMAPFICWSFSSLMFRYRFVDHAVPAM
jgi:hypothetical protein